MRKTPPPDLHKPVPQPIPTQNIIPREHRERIRAGLARFRREHGRRLAALGWNRDNLFLGTSPDEAQSYDHLHGMAVLLAEGAILVFVDRNQLVFLVKDQEWRWFRAGYWVMEKK